MSKNKRERNKKAPEIVTLGLNAGDTEPVEAVEEKKKPAFGFLKKHLWLVGVIAVLSLVALGAGVTYLSNNNTNASKSQSLLSRVNPFTTPTPLPLSKEYIYAGSRLLAVEDANASAVPPGDLAIWRTSEGNWYVLGGPGSTATIYQWGGSGDIPVQADFDGDGKTDFCVFRPSGNTWYFTYSATGSNYSLSFGTSGDIPVPADYDGDGKADVAVFRPSNGTWYILQSSTATTVSHVLGQSGDKVAPADYDGDGKADECTWRYGTTSQFHVLRSSDGGTQTINLGSASTDQPVSADYDGDGKADFALLGGNVWTILSSTTNTSSTTTWQNSGDIPVPNDYDGDGKVDIASWRASTGYWYIRQSHDASTRTQQWGASGDIPVPAYYRR